MKKRNHPLRIVVGLNGVLQSDLDLYQGIRAAAERVGTWRLLPIHDEFEGRLRHLLSVGAVDGVIADFISMHWVRSLAGRLPPLVNLGEADATGLTSGVRVDAAAVGRAAGAHLASLGRSGFACVGVPGVAESRLQFEGLQGACEGRACFLPDGNVESLVQGLSGLPLPLGVLGFSDFQARKVLLAARRLHWRVPQDVAVVGVGDHALDQAYAGIGISSVPVPFARIGALAVEEMTRLLADPGAGRQERLVSPDPLRVRGSSRLPVDGVHRAMQMLEEAPTDPWTMEELARSCGMSRRSFELRFHAVAGTTPYAHLLHLRFEQARQYLRDTDWPVARVAELSGFPEPQRFSAFFRKRAGCSPSTWRATQKKASG